MSRAWLPRRIIAFVLPIGFLLCAPVAGAQDPNSEARAMTVVGNDSNVRQCSALFALGNTTDQAIDACTRALHYPRLTHDNAVQINMAIGVMRLRRREGDGAVTAFDAVLVLEPRNAEAH